MAVRKTQKKHLGKKRKSLSKRKAHSKKKRHSKKRITKKRYHKGGEFLTPEEIYIYKLKDYIKQNCRNDALKKRLLSCIDGEKIDVEFTGNDEDVATFVARLIAKIEQDAPNDVVKDRMIDCVLYASQERPLDVPRLADDTLARGHR